MKVLRVINSMGIGGAERSLVNNVPVHVRNGYDMEVLLLDGTRTFFLDELQNSGVKVRWLGRSLNVYDPLLVFRLLSVFKRYDLIHVHLFPAFYWVAFARILSRARTRLVYTEHNTHNRRRDSALFKWLDRLAYSQYAKVIAISEPTKQLLDAHTGTPGKSVVIPNGVHIEKLMASTGRLPEDWQSRLQGRKVLLQIAGFRPEKDQDTSIRALTELPDDHVLVLVGDGERRSICEQLAVECGVGDRVFFAGLQADVAPWINAADIVVMSSHWEGFGRTAVEGMALGKPVVASNVEGLNAIVEGAGRLFETGNHAQLSATIRALTQDPADYATTAEACRARADLYDVRHMIEGYEKVYRSLFPG